MLLLQLEYDFDALERLDQEIGVALAHTDVLLATGAPVGSVRRRLDSMLTTVRELRQHVLRVVVAVEELPAGAGDLPRPTSLRPV